MKDRQKAIFNLHLAVFLFGFTGVLGKSILLPALTLVWWRALLSCLMMWPAFVKSGGFKTISKRSVYTFLGIGCIVGIHWICFYGSIKLSNSSVAMICLAFIPIFTAIFESLIHRRPLDRLDVFTGFLTIPAMWLIIQHIDLNFRTGLFVGILAALFSALFATLNKKYILSASPMQISWLELFAVWILLSLMLPVLYANQPELKFFPVGMDWIYLLLLSYVCTYIAYVLTIQSLHHLTAFSAMLAFNLEPVYGILLAIALLSEHKDFNMYFYFGVIILLLVVFLHPMLQKKLKSIT